MSAFTTEKLQYQIRLVFSMCVSSADIVCTDFSADTDISDDDAESAPPPKRPTASSDDIAADAEWAPPSKGPTAGSDDIAVHAESAPPPRRPNTGSDDIAADVEWASPSRGPNADSDDSSDDAEWAPPSRGPNAGSDDSSDDAVSVTVRRVAIRCKWTDEELSSIRKAFRPFLYSGTQPRYCHCQQAKDQYPCLNKRTLPQIKARFIYMQKKLN